MSDYTELKRLAEVFPDYEWDGNQTELFSGPNGIAGGEPTGYYCVYGPAYEIDEDTYDGPTLVDACPLDQARFICEAKAGILDLLAERDQLQAENARLTSAIAAQTTRSFVGQHDQAAIDDLVTTGIRAQNAKVKALYRVAVELRGAVTCESMDHHVGEFHAHNEPCPVLARFDAALSAGEWV